jgi:hypothetical protein
MVGRANKRRIESRRRAAESRSLQAAERRLTPGPRRSPGARPPTRAGNAPVTRRGTPGARARRTPVIRRKSADSRRLYGRLVGARASGLHRETHRSAPTTRRQRTGLTPEAHGSPRGRRGSRRARADPPAKQRRLAPTVPASRRRDGALSHREHAGLPPAQRRFAPTRHLTPGALAPTRTTTYRSPGARAPTRADRASTHLRKAPDRTGIALGPSVKGRLARGGTRRSISAGDTGSRRERADNVW